MTPIYATLIGYLFGNFLTAMVVGKIFFVNCNNNLNTFV